MRELAGGAQRERGIELVAAAPRLLRERVGITMEVVLCPPGALAAKTGIESRQKPIRLKDER